MSWRLNAATEWGEKIDLGEWWDRPALKFHMILVGTQKQLDAVSSNGRNAKSNLTIDGLTLIQT